MAGKGAFLLKKEEREKKFKDIIYSCFMNAKYRSEKRGHEFTISIEYLLELFEKQNRKCHYFGLNLILEPHYPMTVSIDRLDSSIGYTKENVVLAGKAANIIKRLQDPIQFIDRFLDFCYTMIETNMKTPIFKEKSINFAKKLLEEYDK